MKQNLVVFSPQNPQKTYNLCEKYPIQTKNMIYIISSYYYSHPIVNPQKSWHPTSESTKSNRLSWPTGRCHTPLRSKSQSLPDWGNQRGSNSRSISVTGGGNPWKDQPPLKKMVVPFQKMIKTLLKSGCETERNPINKMVAKDFQGNIFTSNQGHSSSLC